MYAIRSYYGKDKLEELQKQLVSKYGVEVRIIVKDLGTANAPQEIYDEIKSNNIDIEYLINNAGFGGIGKFHEREWQQDAAMINLNIMALTNLTRLFLPDFIKQNRGRILNVSSTASFRITSYNVCYTKLLREIFKK